MHLVITFNYVIRSHTKQVSKKRRLPLNLDLEVSPLVVCDDGAFHSELLAFFKAAWITTKPCASLSHIRYILRYTLFYSPSHWIVGETQSTTFVVCLLFFMKGTLCQTVLCCRLLEQQGSPGEEKGDCY